MCLFSRYEISAAILLTWHVGCASYVKNEVTNEDPQNLSLSKLETWAREAIFDENKRILNNEHLATAPQREESIKFGVKKVQWADGSKAIYRTPNFPLSNHGLKKIQMEYALHILDANYLHYMIVPRVLLISRWDCNQKIHSFFRIRGSGTLEPFLEKAVFNDANNRYGDEFASRVNSIAGQRIAAFHYLIGIRDGRSGTDWFRGERAFFSVAEFNNVALFENGWMAAIDNVFMDFSGQANSTFIELNIGLPLAKEVYEPLNKLLRLLDESPGEREAFLHDVIEPVAQVYEQNSIDLMRLFTQRLRTLKTDQWTFKRSPWIRNPDPPLDSRANLSAN